MNDKQRCIEFLQSEKLIVIATADQHPHVANVFYGCTDEGTLYFISGKETLHSKHILDSSRIAFSVVWYNKKDHTDRRGVQGVGQCTLCTSEEDIRLGAQLHNENFEEFAERLTPDAGVAGEFSVWKIEPTEIKYWDDEAYGNNGTRDITF